MQNSATLTDIKETFFNGDPERFKTQLRQWVQDFGIRTEDLKNLTISALLAKLLSDSTDDSRKALILSAVSLARNHGLSDSPASTLLSAAANGG